MRVELRSKIRTKPKPITQNYHQDLDQQFPTWTAPLLRSRPRTTQHISGGKLQVWNQNGKDNGGVYTTQQTSNKRPANVQLHYNIWQQTNSKLPANVQQTSSNLRVFWIHLLEVCWTFAGSCKHPINYRLTEYTARDHNYEQQGKQLKAWSLLRSRNSYYTTFFHKNFAVHMGYTND